MSARLARFVERMASLWALPDYVEVLHDEIGLVLNAVRALRLDILKPQPPIENRPTMKPTERARNLATSLLDTLAAAAPESFSSAVSNMLGDAWDAGRKALPIAANPYREPIEGVTLPSEQAHCGGCGALLIWSAGIGWLHPGPPVPEICKIHLHNPSEDR